MRPILFFSLLSLIASYVCMDAERRKTARGDSLYVYEAFLQSDNAPQLRMYTSRLPMYYADDTPVPDRQAYDNSRLDLSLPEYVAVLQLTYELDADRSGGGRNTRLGVRDHRLLLEYVIEKSIYQFMVQQSHCDTSGSTARLISGDAGCASYLPEPAWTLESTSAIWRLADSLWASALKEKQGREAAAAVRDSIAAANLEVPAR